MKPIAPFQFIMTGVLHFYLQSIKPGTPVHGDDGALLYLTRYLDHLNLIGFEMTTSAAWGLNGVREELEAAETAAVLDHATATKIQRFAYEARETLYAEGRSRTLFEVTGKKFDVTKLLYDVGALMRKGHFEQLPILAVIDLGEAGLCIAFERPTAAAFHTLRATEGVLRHYYSCYVKHKRLKKPWLWKPMLDDMGSRRRKPPKPLLDHLDAIRDNFRNPTQHPEKLYDIAEAQDAFGQCLDAIGRMVADKTWVEPGDSWRMLRERVDARAAAD